MDEVYDDLSKTCGDSRLVYIQLGAIYCWRERNGNPLNSFSEEDMPVVAHTIHSFVKFIGLKNLNDATEDDLAKFREQVLSGAISDVEASLLYVIRSILRFQLEINRKDGIELPRIAAIEPLPHREVSDDKDAMEIASNDKKYGLEKIVPKDSPVYKQIFSYYHYCDCVCRMSPKTMSVKTEAINGFIKFSGISRLEDIDNQQIYDWISSQTDRGNSGRSINNRLSQLKVMLRWQRDDNVVMPKLKISRIAKQKEVPPRQVYFTREQIYKVLALADRREWLMIKMAFDCGFRITELRTLRMTNIHGDHITYVGKGQKKRHVKLDEEVMTRLNDYIEREHITDYLWASVLSPNKPICDEDMRKAMRKPFKDAGFDDFCPHDLRRSFATDLKILGVSTREIQVGMGHSTEATTERYLKDLIGYNTDSLYDMKYSAAAPALR